MYMLISILIIVLGAMLTSYQYFSFEQKTEKTNYGVRNVGPSRFDVAMAYGFGTFVSAIVWPVAIPAIVAILIGYKIAKRKKS